MPKYLIVGREIVANYGAMFPVIEAEIDRVDDEGWAYFRGYNNEEMNVRIENIKKAEERSVNGSPIGVFWKNI